MGFTRFHLSLSLIAALLVVQSISSLTSALQQTQLSFPARPADAIDRALGQNAPLFRALESALHENGAGPASGGRPSISFLLPSEGLSTDIQVLIRLMDLTFRPLAAFLDPGALRPLRSDLNPGPLNGDEFLTIVELGPHVEKPFMVYLEEIMRAPDFRIYRLSPEMLE